MKNSILKKFSKYVSLNVIGMIGLSSYILADTFFVSKALGATGIAGLNLSISVYNIIHGLGLMIGTGGATRYTILKMQDEDEKSNQIYSLSIAIGIFGSETLAVILGADKNLLPYTKTYLTVILIFAPFLILNNILLAFVRNDNSPRLSMIAMVTGSVTNIILDYIFMFPLDMGMFGAALATGLAPIASMSVLSVHFISKSNSFNLTKIKIKVNSIIDILGLGLSAFITEFSSAIVLIIFNLIILNIAGNIGVAAYGIVANLALVGISILQVYPKESNH